MGFANFLWKLAGWKLQGVVPSDIKKAVIIAAPHTSNWDFYYGKLAFYLMKVPVKILIKKELFFWPMGALLRVLGGMPVDRKKGGNLVEALTTMFEEQDELILLFTPEGTRNQVKDWKKGFYNVAVKANVPILLGFMNYRDKIGGVGGVFYPTGNAKEDIAEIMRFYYDKPGKYPEQGVHPPA